MVTFDWSSNDAKKKFMNFDDRRRLSWIVLEVTDRCNFKCKWCYSNSWRNKNPKDLSYRRVSRVLGYLADEGVGQVTLSGGEPTMYPYLRQTIKEARDLGLVVHMNTNGFLFDEKMAEDLYSLGLSQIQVNIDSLDPDKHDRIRGMRGSWHRAVGALMNARDVGMTAACQTVLTSENEDEILDIFKFARSMGIPRCRTWDMTSSNGFSAEDLKLLPRDYMSSLQMLADYAHSSGAKNIEAGEPLFKQHIKTPLNISGGFCVAEAGLYATISNTGGVYFCATIRKPLYNIFDIMSAGLNLNPNHTRYITSFLENKKIAHDCMRCPYLDNCKGGCLTRLEQMKNRLDYWCKIAPSASRIREYINPHPLRT